MLTLFLTALAGWTLEHDKIGAVMQIFMFLSCIWQFYKVFPYLKIFIKQKMGMCILPDLASMSKPSYGKQELPQEIKRRVWCKTWDKLLLHDEPMLARFNIVSDQVKMVGRDKFIAPVRWHAFNFNTVEFLLSNVEGNDAYYDSPETSGSPFGLLETKRFPFGLTFVSDAGRRVEFRTDRNIESTLPQQLVQQNNVKANPALAPRLQRRLTFRAMCKTNCNAQVYFYMVRRKQPRLKLIRDSQGLVYDAAQFTQVTVQWQERQIQRFTFVERTKSIQVPFRKPDGTQGTRTETEPVWATRDFEMRCDFSDREWRPRHGLSQVEEVDIEGATLFQARTQTPPTNYGMTTQRPARTMILWRQRGDRVLGSSPPTPAQDSSLYTPTVYSPVARPKPRPTLTNRNGTQSAVDLESVTVERDYTYENGDMSVVEAGGPMQHVQDGSMGSNFAPQLHYPRGWAKDAYRTKCPNISHTTASPTVLGWTPTFENTPVFQTLVQKNLQQVNAGWAGQGKRLGQLRAGVKESWRQEVGALSEKFWVDVYANYSPQITPRSVLEQHFSHFEYAEATRAFVSTHRGDIDDLYAKMYVCVGVCVPILTTSMPECGLGFDTSRARLHRTLSIPLAAAAHLRR